MANNRSGAGKKSGQTRMDYWGMYGKYDENYSNGNNGFTEGIERLTKIFGGNLLEWPAKAHVDPELAEALNSLWQRGLRQLADPALNNYYAALFSSINDAELKDTTRLPYPMQLCISYVAWTNAEDGRFNQRQLDMHTQFQGGVQHSNELTKLKAQIAEYEAIT